MATEVKTTTPSAFSPFTLRGTVFKNRLGVSPMCTYSSEDGFYSDWHLVHLGSRAVGGYGLVIAEATGVSPEGRISPGDGGLWKDEHVAPLKKIADFIKGQGAVFGIQLAHAGRKASAARPWEGDHHLKEEEGGWEIVAPSAIAFGQNLWKVPRELTVEEILAIEDKFASAAKRAVEAGVQVIEIHAAHGYLLHEFYSPLSNKRTDNYGGSFENRTRFLIETVNKIRAAIPAEVLLFIRISSTDWDPEGWTIEDSVTLGKVLKTLGVDLVDVSSGFVIPNYASVPFGKGFQVPLSEKFRSETGLPTSTVGFITEPEQAEEIIREGKADIVLTARESLRNPHFPYIAAKALQLETPASVFPSQYSHWLKR